MKKLCLAVLLCMVAAGQAQNGASGTISTSGTCATTLACVISGLLNAGGATISVNTIGSQTIQFEATNDPNGVSNPGTVPTANWSAISSIAGTSTGVSSTTTTGTFQFGTSGYTAIRARGSAYSSGSAGIIIAAGGSAPATPGGTGPFIDTGGAVYNLKAYPNLQCGINAACAGGNGNILDMGGVQATLVQGTQITIACPLKIQNCHTTISLSMADPGQSSGGILVTSDGVSIEGTVGDNRACILTRANGSNVQNLIYTGQQNNISLQWLTYDGNEDNQTYTDNSTTYYTGWHNSALGGGSNLNFNHNYVTRGGARAIDWRGVNNYHILHNEFFETGWNIGGTHQSRGNSVSVDVGFNSGTYVYSTGGECIDNTVDIQGDSFRCGNNNYKIIGLDVYGAAYGGVTPFRAAGSGLIPWWTESGVDATGAINATFSGVHVYDVYNTTFGLNAYSVGTTQIPVNDQITNSGFYADSAINSFGYYGSATNNVSAASLFTISDAALAVQLKGISVTNTTFQGVPVLVRNVLGFSASGNVYDTVSASGWGTLTTAPTSTWSGVTACTNGTQTITFTNNTFAVNATGTVSVSGGVPTGAVTLVKHGIGYAVGTPPTTGTVATCTGTASFTGGTVTPAVGNTAVTVGGASMANFQLQGVVRNVGTGYFVESTTNAPSTCTIDVADIDAGVTTPLNYAAGASAICNALSSTTLLKSSTDAVGPPLNFEKSRGSVASPTAVVSNDTLGQLNFSGYDGTNYTAASLWKCYPVGTVSAGIVQGQCLFDVANVSGVETLVATMDATEFRSFVPLQLFESTGSFHQTFVINATANRNFTMPDAASNPVQPLASAPTGGCVGFVDNTGTQNGANCAHSAGSIHLTGLTGNQGSTSVATAPGSGRYLVCGYVAITTGQATCTIASSLGYTNPGGTTSPALWAASGIGGAAGNDKGACSPIYLASGNISISATVGTCSPSTLVYELDAWVTAIP